MVRSPTILSIVKLHSSNSVAFGKAIHLHELNFAREVTPQCGMPNLGEVVRTLTR